MSAKRRSQGSRQEDLTCSLCHQAHTHLTVPCTWKDERAKMLILFYNVPLNNLVCRPCRDDISRCLKESDYQPRWQKIHKTHCCIDGCDQQILANYRPQNMDKLTTTLQELHITTNNEVPIPMPLCTHHYHQIMIFSY